MVISPGALEAMRQLFHGLDTLAIPNEKAYDRGRHTTHQPNQIFHGRPYVIITSFIITTNLVGVWMQKRVRAFRRSVRRG
jgi:hypothetical protein